MTFVRNTDEKWNFKCKENGTSLKKSWRFQIWNCAASVGFTMNFLRGHDPNTRLYNNYWTQKIVKAYGHLYKKVAKIEKKSIANCNCHFQILMKMCPVNLAQLCIWSSMPNFNLFQLALGRKRRLNCAWIEQSYEQDLGSSTILSADSSQSSKRFLNW